MTNFTLAFGIYTVVTAGIKIVRTDFRYFNPAFPYHSLSCCVQIWDKIRYTEMGDGIGTWKGEESLP